MKVGFTGTQEGMSLNQAKSLAAYLAKLTRVAIVEFHHGDCIGADAESDAIAREAGCSIVIHPPDNPSKRAFCAQPGDTVLPEKPYLHRNRDIVDATGILFAAPKGPEELRSGTWSTVRYARGRKVVQILPR